MAITPQAVAQALMKYGETSPFPFYGPAFPVLAQAIGVGFTSWLPSVVVQGVTTGTVGAGAVTGVMTIAPNPALVVSTLSGQGVNGPLGASLGYVVGMAIPEVVATQGMYMGSSSGVGLGADVSQVVAADPSSLSAAIASAYLPGITTPKTLMGISLGIVNLLMSGVGLGSVSGPPSPSPGSGVSISTLF